eukprot:763635-Hanusia_phi.AAC.2
MFMKALEEGRKAALEEKAVEKNPPKPSPAPPAPPASSAEVSSQHEDILSEVDLVEKELGWQEPAVFGAEVKQDRKYDMSSEESRSRKVKQNGSKSTKKRSVTSNRKEGAANEQKSLKRDRYERCHADPSDSCLSSCWGQKQHLGVSPVRPHVGGEAGSDV